MLAGNSLCTHASRTIDHTLRRREIALLNLDNEILPKDLPVLVRVSLMFRRELFQQTLTSAEPDTAVTLQNQTAEVKENRGSRTCWPRSLRCRVETWVYALRWGRVRLGTSAVSGKWCRLPPIIWFCCPGLGEA